MTLDWNAIVAKLNAYPEATHKLRPPCSEQRVRDVESKLGHMPNDVRGMLKHFNGAALFIDAMQMIALYGISDIPPPSRFEWPPEWNMDEVTPAWRQAHGQPTDWAIGVTNYGGLIIADANEMIRQWDKSTQAWDPLEPGPWTFQEWIDRLFQEGDAYLAAD